MKAIKTIIIIASILFIISCSTESKKIEKQIEITELENLVEETPDGFTEFNIKGKLEGGVEKKIYLYHFNSQTPTVIDSNTIGVDNSFSLKGKGKGYQFYGVGSTPKKIKLLMLNNTENLTIKGNYNSIYEADIEGSEDSKILNLYSNKKQEFYSRMKEIQDKLKSISNNNKSSIDKNSLIKESDKITKEFSKFVINFIDENISSPAILTASGDLFDPNTQIEYLKKIENTLSKTMNNSIYHNSIKSNIARLQQQVRQKPQGNSSVIIGNEATELSYPSPTDANISLSSLRGKIVLIDFWASWCKPCRIENPNVVKLYNKYKDKGFTVYSVSLDKDKARWVNAIKQDGLIWDNHVSDLKGWQSEAALKYGVKGIPYTVLIDKDGKILATNLRGPYLEQKLEQILGK